MALDFNKFVFKWYFLEINNILYFQFFLKLNLCEKLFWIHMIFPCQIINILFTAFIFKSHLSKAKSFQFIIFFFLDLSWIFIVIIYIWIPIWRLSLRSFNKMLYLAWIISFKIISFCFLIEFFYFLCKNFSYFNLWLIFNSIFKSLDIFDNFFLSWLFLWCLIFNKVINFVEFYLCLT